MRLDSLRVVRLAVILTPLASAADDLKPHPLLEAVASTYGD